MNFLKLLRNLSALIAVLAAPCNAQTAKNRPLVEDRIVFNWHNFLSGCSTWNFEDWSNWTEKSRIMGYNAIMVHAYGNNPMSAFTLQNLEKPVGYLSTTASGRDWSTMHVNDVRRLIGGEVFNGPVFGAEAGMVPDAQRVKAAKSLMSRVFADAAKRNMGVFFAMDVDTPSANPQDLILKLPESARFKSPASGLWLPNPDTPEGYAYFKAQVRDLLTSYPQITTLTVWFRADETPWMSLKREDLPEAWQKEYASEIARTSGADKLWKSASLFSIGKIVAAYERAKNGIGAKNVRIAAGSWWFRFLPAADRFFPKNVTLIGLDYEVIHDKSQISTPPLRAELAAIGARRPLIPVIWAQHDDGQYLGRSYTPYSDFHSRLVESKAAGFGVIHWTTRPLDLFFVSHARQVFSETKNEPLRTTCEVFAKENLGQPKLAKYLYEWITKAPQFGRDSSEQFIIKPITDAEAVIAGCRERLVLLEEVKGPHADYFREMERFMAAFYEAQDLFQRAQAAYAKSNFKEASEFLSRCRPEDVIRQFAKAIKMGDITRGDQGLVVTLNTRWLTNILQLRQALGMEPVRYHFAPTSHDPLAQSPGRFSYFFEADHMIWQTRGAKETGADLFEVSANKDIARHGLQSETPIALKVKPIMEDIPNLLPGNYQLRLLFLDPDSTAVGQREIRISVHGATQGEEIAEPATVDVFKEAGGANRVWEHVVPVILKQPGQITVTLTPVKGTAVITGMILEPLDK